MIGAAACASGAALHAQNGDTAVSREVVQALPSPEVAALNSALNRLARNTRDLGALIDAGNAALALGDIDAAMGFFGRAEELSPGNAKVKLGMAAVFMRSQRPVEALRMFKEAETAGAKSDALAADRGLAYDLVGNNREAQAAYRMALKQGANDEITRRLAISLAISGDRKRFDEALRPLLMKRDLAAYRARAFGLAILGEQNEARGIVTTVIPRDLASRIIPYLEFMPRLTRAQQAAAANLGIFPRAAEIGRDDPVLAQYRSPQTRALSAPASANQVTGASTPAATQVPAKAAVGSASPPLHPRRLWVQFATGPDARALRNEWRRARNKAGAAFAHYEPHSAEWQRGLMLLVGPLDDDEAARALLRDLDREGIKAVSYTSRVGEKVEPLQ